MNILFIKPYGYKQAYSVTITTLNRESNPQRSTLKYTITLSLEDATMKGIVIRIRRSDVLLNNTKHQAPINEMLLIAGQALNDLRMEVTQYGEICRIKNFKEIQKKWNETRFKIEKTYKGEIVEQMLESMEHAIKDEEELIKSLDKDPFIFNYFKGLYGEYDNTPTKFKGNIWGLSRNLPIPVHKRCMINESSKDWCSIHAISVLTDEGSQMLNKELEEKYGKGSAEVEIKYRYVIRQAFHIETLEMSQKLFWNKQTVKSLEMDVKPQ